MALANPRIVSLCPAPAAMVDKYENIICGFALVEFEGGERDVLPFGTDGGIFGLPDDLFYEAHALGDNRPLSGVRFASPGDDVFEKAVF